MSQYFLPFAQRDHVTTPTEGNTKPRSMAAQQCRTAAGQMQKHIETKHKSADGLLLQPPTRRRLAASDALRQEAQRLEKIQVTLLRLADLHEKGSITPELASLTSRAAIERALFQGQSALHVIYQNASGANSAQKQAIRMEREALLKGIPGFFPTPPELASRVVDFALIEQHHSLFEPSAGVGSLIDAVLNRYPEAAVSYCELNCYLLDVLRFKYSDRQNIHFVSRDFEELDWKQFSTRFDRVIMNPPFERGRDMDHVLRGYEFLARRGMLTAIVSESGFHRQDKKAQAFREFLGNRNAVMSELPSASFKECGTKVDCRLVRVTKDR